MKKLLFFLLFLLGPGCSSYNLQKDINYQEGNQFAYLDCYQPTDDLLKHPALLFIHGGGYYSGNKKAVQKFVKEFCPTGYVVFSIDYRLAPQYHWPAQIEDCQSALQYIRQNATQFRVDPDKIASIGVSAGANLATMLALRDSKNRVKVAVDLDGEMDMTLPGDQCMANYDDIMTKVLGHASPWHYSELADISPIYFARPDVSIFILHGANDNNVYAKNSDLMYQKLVYLGADVEYIKIFGSRGNCHGDCWDAPDFKKILHDFLDRHLKN